MVKIGILESMRSTVEVIFNFVIRLSTKDLLSTHGMRYGAHLFSTCFCGGGALFVWNFVPEIKDKDAGGLELALYFGADSNYFAQADKVRMDRVYESLCLAGLDRPEDLCEKDQAGVRHHHDEQASS